jgi:predicted RNA-binding Zn-ribbon protein involved in translation (DUF1610 family)
MASIRVYGIDFCHVCDTTHIPDDPTIEYWMRCPLCGDMAFQLTRKPESMETFPHTTLVGGRYGQQIPKCCSCGRQVQNIGAFSAFNVIVRPAVRRDP